MADLLYIALVVYGATTAAIFTLVGILLLNDTLRRRSVRKEEERLARNRRRALRQLRREERQARRQLEESRDDTIFKELKNFDETPW